MIGSLIGGLVGLAGSAVPAVLDTVDKKNERKHELAMRQIDAELAREGRLADLKMSELDADKAELKALYEHATQAPTSGFVGALQASVRPIITYAFFTLFLATKLSALGQAWGTGVPLAEAMTVVWDQDTAAVFAAVLGFWFGSRAMTRFGYARHK